MNRGHAFFAVLPENLPHIECKYQLLGFFHWDGQDGQERALLWGPEAPLGEKERERQILPTRVTEVLKRIGVNIA